MADILITGGTSRVGRACVSILEQRGHRVRLLARDAARASTVSGKSEVVVGDLTRPTSLPVACEGVATVVSLAGAPLTAVGAPSATFEAIDHQGTAALARAAADAGVQRFVYLSVAGDYPPGLAYVDAHRRAEAAIANCGLLAAVVRATGFQGTLTMLVDLARAGLIALPGSGNVRTNPIAESDLAAVLADQATADLAPGSVHTIEVGGPEVLTRRQIAEAAFTAIGTRPRILPIPTGAMRIGAGALRPVHPRIAALTSFFAWLHDHDGIAPAVGTTTLSETFRAYASR